MERLNRKKQKITILDYQILAQIYFICSVVSSFYFNVLGQLLIKKQTLLRITAYEAVVDYFSPIVAIKGNSNVVRIVTKKTLSQVCALVSTLTVHHRPIVSS